MTLRSGLADHKREIREIIEVDAVGNGRIRGVQPGQLHGIALLPLNGCHRLTLAEGLDILAGLGCLAR